MTTVRRFLSLGAVLVWAGLTAAVASAHGLSDVGARYELTPAGAGPGERVQIVVHLTELESGASDGGRVSADLTANRRTERVPLSTQGGNSYEGELTLGSGTHDLRVFFERAGKREVALAGFRVGKALEMPPEKERELWFVPSGKFDPIPWLDHAAGIVVALLAIAAIAVLFRAPTSPRVPGGDPKPVLFLAIAAAGAVAMPFGGYWDVSTHTTEGREGFFSTPHLLIYGGILLALLAVSVTILLKKKGMGWREHLRSDRAATLAAVAMVAQLASGPFDELWHGLFGLDVGIWSPPHAVLILGGVAVCLALSAIHVRAGIVTTVLRAMTLGGALLTAELFLGEYEFTVPSWHSSQARPAQLVIPGFLILFGGVTALMAKRALRSDFGATFAASAFLVLRLLLYPYLALVSRGESPKLSPWVLAPLGIALAIDLWKRAPAVSVDSVVPRT